MGATHIACKTYRRKKKIINGYKLGKLKMLVNSSAGFVAVICPKPPDMRNKQEQLIGQVNLKFFILLEELPLPFFEN